MIEKDKARIGGQFHGVLESLKAMTEVELLPQTPEQIAENRRKLIEWHERINALIRQGLSFEEAQAQYRREQENDHG